VRLTHTTVSSRASIRAFDNLRANRDALGIELGEPDGEFVFGRDGYLTLRELSGAWHTGCSLPHRAAQAMLKKMPVSGRVACFLGPTHAAHLRVALDQLRFDQAIIAIMPDAADFEIAMHCDDFSKEIDSHRIFFATGADWAEELATVFRRHPGLAPPSHFVRLATLGESECDAMMRAAQKVFSAVANERAEQIKAVWRDRGDVKRDTPRLCLVATDAFRLWDDAGHTLASLLGNDESVIRLDPDDPASTSPLAVAQAASQSDVILSANMFRGDAPAGIVPESIPWITWVTNSRIPAIKGAGLRDRLIVIDGAQKERAITAGWDASRVDVAGWPVTRLDDSLSREAAVICDVPPLECPDSLAEYSSFKLLWESAREELLRDPMVLRDVDVYLASLRRKLSIGEEGFPRATFIDGLIIPAWQIGWAQALIRAKAPLRIYGRGWDLPQSRGPIETREQLQCAVAQASCLLDLWPTSSAPHPIHFAGRSVVRPLGKTITQVLAEIQSPQQNAIPSTPISRELLLRILFA
jgi:hypothetical protein